MEWSKWRAMWILVMFDLPVDTKDARRDYTRFRKMLLDDGFLQLQYSVYGRSCPSEENAAVHDSRVRTNLPPDGEVRILHLTDAQYGRMKVYYGKIRQETERTGEQLEIF